MKTIKKTLLAVMLSIVGLANISTFTLAAGAESVEELLHSSIWNAKGLGLNGTLEESNTEAEKWADMFNEQILSIIGYVIDVFIVIWIAVAFFGWYKIMMSGKEEDTKEGIRLVIFGIIWIIIMVSARFLAEGLVWNWWIISDEFKSPDDTEWPSGIELASNLYDTILFPFIKLVLYFVIGILFFMMAAKVVWFLTATDDSVKKKAGWVIIWCVVWILIIMWAKQLVEAIMWKQNDVLKKEAQWIDEQWNQILTFEEIPLIHQVLNWIMWLTMFIILILIVVQGYKLFTKPDDPKVRESLKKTLLYIIIGVLVIWASYAISSVLIINNINN